MYNFDSLLILSSVMFCAFGAPINVDGEVPESVLLTTVEPVQGKTNAIVVYFIYYLNIFYN